MAQKTIDFEKDILEPIDTLKQGLSAESDARKKDVQTLDNNKITKFYTSNQGQKVLNDSDDGKIQDLVIYGKSEQKQYKGTNLLNVTLTKTTANGVTCINNGDGTYTIQGTATADTGFIVGYIDGGIEVDKMYKLVGCPSGGSKTTYMLLLHETTNWSSTVDIGNGMTVRYSNNYVLRVMITIKSGVTVNNLVFKPMVTLDTTATYDDYEPYTGGKPSPSPEYPQEIKAVVNPTVKTHGINLLDIKDVTERVHDKNGLTYSVKQGVIKVKGTATSSFGIVINFLSGDGKRKKLIANNTYIFNPNPTKNRETSICYLDFTNNTTFGFSIQSNNIDKPKNVSEAEVKDAYVLVIRVKQDQKIDMEWKPQLIISNTLLPYQPYQETQATLTHELYAIPVESGGNVTIDSQQYIADYVDAESGKLVKCIGSKTIDGTEIYIHEEGWNNNAFVIYGILKDGISYANYTDIADIMTDKLVKKSATAIADGGVIGIGSTSRNLFICLGDKYNTIEKIKEYFSSNKTVVYYVLEIPTTINLTLEQITAFKALSTYYPKTYISAESKQLEAYTMFNYPVSMEKGWEYVKQQIGDTRKYVYDMETKLSDAEYDTAMAYVNSEYAVALTELGM